MANDTMTSSSRTLTPPEKQFYAVAYSLATRFGMPPEDAKDCASGFVAHLWKTQQTPGVTLSALQSPAWVRRCAHNYACNYLRALNRRRQREAPATVVTVHAQPSRAVGPRTLTLRRELWHHVVKALQQLTPNQRDLFIRFHLKNQTLQQLAEHYGRTPHALAESLSQTRKRLATLLRSQGWTEAEALALFRPAPQLPPSSARPPAV